MFHYKLALPLLALIFYPLDQRYLTTNSYVFYEVAKSYDLTRTILFHWSKPQW